MKNILKPIAQSIMRNEVNQEIFRLKGEIYSLTDANKSISKQISRKEGALLAAKSSKRNILSEISALEINKAGNAASIAAMRESILFLSMLISK